jgi:hypothetical protein
MILPGFAPLPKSEPWQEAQLVFHKDFPFKPAMRNASAVGLVAAGVVAAGVVVAVVVVVVAAGSVVAVLVPPPQAKRPEVMAAAKISLVAVLAKLFEYFKVVFPFFMVSECVI